MSGKRKKNEAHADIVANPPTRPRNVGGEGGVNEDLNSWLSEITIDTSPYGITYLADWNLKPVVAGLPCAPTSVSCGDGATSSGRTLGQGPSANLKICFWGMPG